MSAATISQETLTVEYAPIPGCTGYRAGTDGSIWSCLKIVGSRWHNDQRNEPVGRWKKLKGDPRKEDGRLRYTLRRDDGRYRRAYGGVLVLEAFCGPCPSGMECCHWNGICTDDSLGNVRWDTSVANKADMKRHGTARVGERHFKAKILDADIPKIIAMRAGGAKLKSIGAIFNVTEQRIFQIVKKGSR